MAVLALSPFSRLERRCTPFLIACALLFHSPHAFALPPGNPSPQGTSSPTQPVILAPISMGVRLGTTQQFTASRNGVVLTSGTWTLGAPTGTITSSGLYQAPPAEPAQPAIYVYYKLGGTTYTTRLVVWNSQVTLSSASPSALTAPSTLVILSGAGFEPASIVSLNGAPVSSTYIDPTHLKTVISLQGPGESVSLTVANPYPGNNFSAPLLLADNLPLTSVAPTIVSGGPVTLVVTGSGFSATSIVVLNGKELKTTLASSSTLTATGYVAPWSNGSVAVGVIGIHGSAPTNAVSIPIAPPPMPYDVASRFATQAAFGPRHDVIEHIQQVGLSNFITEQMRQPALTYSVAACMRCTFLDGVLTGNSLLRQRVSLALQSFIVNQGNPEHTYVNIPWQQKMENDAFGNFRQVLEDASSDVLTADFLNLNNNFYSANPKVHPNQNFARELLQLFSLGQTLLNQDGSNQLDGSRNTIPTYDETTILNLTLALTGWTNPPPENDLFSSAGTDYSRPMVAVQRGHDTTRKTIFGSVLPAGQSALADREAALDIIFHHPNVAPFVSRILIQRLVASSPSPAYTQRIAQVFADDGNSVRGNLAAVVRAILLDPEARAGDTTTSNESGFLQDPWISELFTLGLLQQPYLDGEPTYIPSALGEDVDFAPTVFGFYSPAYVIPGTNINSPEFSLLNNVSLIQRQQYLWAMIDGGSNGFHKSPNSYLFSTFTTVPELVDALNHILFHGSMSATTQASILTYVAHMDQGNAFLPREVAAFLALNSDSYQVSH